MAPLPSTSQYQLSINNLTRRPLWLHLPTFASPLLVDQSTRVVYHPAPKDKGKGHLLHVSAGDELERRGMGTEHRSGSKLPVKLQLSRWKKRTRLLEMDASAPYLVYQQRTARREYTLTIIPRPKLEQWMSLLPDSRSLASLYIPGTHESLAFYGGPISTCQEVPIPSALRSGVRFLDLRFSLKGGSLKAYHGIQNEYCTAEQAVQWVYDFLEGEGRGETVIVGVKQENAAPDFEATLWALLDRRREMWYRENRWPLLGEVRGKAVMFCRFGFSSGQGLHPATWPNNSPTAFELELGGQHTIIQDWYSIGSFIRIPEKAALVLSLFRPSPSANSEPAPPRTPSLSSSDTLVSSTVTSSNSRSRRPLRISFLSGATLITAFPYLVAKGFGYSSLSSLLGFPGVNQRVLDGLLARGALGEQQGGAERKGEEAVQFEGGMFLLGDFLEFPGGLVELFIAWNDAE